jgi:hypothetical protein
MAKAVGNSLSPDPEANAPALGPDQMARPGRQSWDSLSRARGRAREVLDNLSSPTSPARGPGPFGICEIKGELSLRRASEVARLLR